MTLGWYRSLSGSRGLPLMVLGLVLGAAAIFATMRRHGPQGFFPRPDGSSVGILGLTLPMPPSGVPNPAGNRNPQHRLVPPYWSLTRFLDNLPRGLSVSKSAYDQPYSQFAPNNSLGIWVGERFSMAPTGTLSFTSIAQVDMIATNGFRFPATSASGQPSRRWNQGRTLIDFFSGPAFPRRQRTFEIELHDRNPTNPPIRRTIANPFWKPVTDWIPVALPCRQSIAGTTVSLTGFDPLTIDGLPQTNAFQPVFEIGEAPDGTRHWRPGNWKLADAAGNWGPILDPAESAWRVTAQFLRELRGDFASHEVWATNLSAFPAPGEFQLANTAISIGGHPFRIIAVAGPGKYDVRHDLLRLLSVEPATGFSLSRFRPLVGTQGVPEMSIASPNPFVLIRCLESQSDSRIDQPLGVRLRGADGAEVVTTERFRGDANGVRCYRLLVPADAVIRSLELLFPVPVDLQFTVFPPGRHGSGTGMETRRFFK